MHDFLLGSAVVAAAIIYFEIRHGYFARKIGQVVGQAHIIATTAATVAQGAKTAVEQIKKTV